LGVDEFLKESQKKLLGVLKKKIKIERSSQNKNTDTSQKSVTHISASALQKWTHNPMLT
jgi:hypothetical protein